MYKYDGKLKEGRKREREGESGGGGEKGWADETGAENGKKQEWKIRFRFPQFALFPYH